MIQENTEKKGYVYILVNPAFPGFLKVGKTTKEPDARAKELSTGTGVPAPYAVAWDALVRDCDQVEKLIHQQLAFARSRKDREFFAVPLKNAISVVSNIIAPFACAPSDPSAESPPTNNIVPSLSEPGIRPRQRGIWGQKENLILTAEDCPVTHSMVPEKNISHIEYETFIDNPYIFTEEEFFHEVHVVRRNMPALKYKSYRFTRSLLPRQFGWGIHINEQGKAGLVAMESDLYKELQKSIRTTKSYGSLRRVIEDGCVSNSDEKIHSMSNHAEHSFDLAMMNIYHRARTEVNYNAKRFLQMLHDHRGLETARILLHSDTVSDGYTALWERGRLDLTVEALILKPQWHELFTETERNIAQKRLQDYDYALNASDFLGSGL